MKYIVQTMLVCMMAVCSIAYLCGCEGGGGGESTNNGHPASIAGKWTGYQSSSAAKYPIVMTLTQKGALISGTYVKGMSSFMNPRPDYSSTVVGTYDSSTGIFMWGTLKITFIDDNTMYWRTTNPGADYKTTLYRR